MGARCFNFAPKFSKNGRFLALKFAFPDDDFSTRRKITNRVKFDHEAIGSLPATTPVILQLYVRYGFLLFVG